MKHFFKHFATDICLFEQFLYHGSSPPRLHSINEIACHHF